MELALKFQNHTPNSLQEHDMNRFEKLSVSGSGRPVLLKDERTLIQQPNIGLYNGSEKAKGYEKGIAYVTSHRLLWIDENNSQNNAVTLLLCQIGSVSMSAGFLTTSPKITLELSASSTHTSTSSTPTSPATIQWTCTICSTVNTTNEILKCKECGVIRKEISCQRCSFLNDPEKKKCEICGEDLNTKPPISLSSLSLSGKNDNKDIVKLSFRSGGNAKFLEELEAALAAKAWEVKARETVDSRPTASTGISGLMQHVDTKQQGMQATVQSAFKDLDALMEKAQEMVKLAEIVASKTALTEGSSEMSTFRSYLLDLGVSSTVTRETSGDSYHKELAKELSDFLDKIIVSHNGMISLTDLYCLYNRARGVALISPEDLSRSITLFEQLQLPYRIRVFEHSGLITLQSLKHYSEEVIANRVKEFVAQQGGSISCIQLSWLLGVSPVLAMEELLIAENKGFVVRDETAEGLLFYENKITPYILEWPRSSIIV